MVRSSKILTAEEMRKLMREAVHDAFLDAGLAIKEEDHMLQARADFTFLRRLRQGFDTAASTIGRVVLMAVIAGIIGATWLGIKLGLK